jgi:hypothetical protein
MYRKGNPMKLEFLIDGKWVENQSTTCSTPSSDVILEHMQQAIALLKNTKKLFIFFSPYASTICYGELVNKWLLLSKDEEGFIVPESLRSQMEQYEDCYEEIDKFVVKKEAQ